MKSQLRVGFDTCQSTSAAWRADGKALISNISLRRGAHLEIHSCGDAELKLVMSEVPIVRFANLPSPISTEYQYHGHKRSFRPLGPNGGVVLLQESPMLSIPRSPFAERARVLELRYLRTFMEEPTQFASNRNNATATSAWLCRVARQLSGRL